MKTIPTDLRELRDHLENEFADLLSPDLKANGASEIYVVLVSETDLLAADAKFDGLHGPAMSDWFRSEIGERWQGLGPCFLVNDNILLNNSCEDSFIATAVHELGHAIDTPGLYTRANETGGSLPEGFVARVFSSHRVAVRSARYGHGPSWIRACCHLVHRLRQRGWECRLPMVIDNDFYSLSSTSLYRNALGDEPSRLAAWPLTAIGQLPPPQKFLDQWNSDLTAWPDGEF